MWWPRDDGPTRASAMLTFGILVVCFCADLLLRRRAIAYDFKLLVHRVIRIIYNLFFHPLAKFPGPPWAAASYVPYALKLVNGTFSVWVKDLHDQYQSEVVRISPNDLSFINPQGWKDICGYRVGHIPFEKDVAVYGKAYNGNDTLLTAKKPDHSRMRRVLDYAFTTKALKEQTPVIFEHVDRLIDILTTRVGKDSDGRMDLAQWYAWMTFDVIGERSGSCLMVSHVMP